LQAKEPIFNVPAGVLAVLAAMIAVHAGRQYLLSPDANMDLLLALAFIPSRYAGFAGEIPGGELAKVTSFVTHMFVHSDAVHVLINSAWFLAFGSVLCRRVGALRFLAFTVSGAVAGALTFLAFHPGLGEPVIGASGAVAALMGGVMRFLFSAIDRGRGHELRENPSLIPRMSLAAAFTDRRIVLASIAFIGINLLTLIGFGTFGAVGSIAWEAHLGGYFFGLLAFALFDVRCESLHPTQGKPE
jgi:membrane associated rhomboid family serine protease